MHLPWLVAYAAHEDGWVAGTGRARFTDGGTHPEVYIAYGSHAAYHSPGIRELRRKGVLYAVDVANGKGTRLSVGRKMTSGDALYQLRLITDDEEWLAWEGRWGNDPGPSPLDLVGLPPSHRGPTGPRHKPLWTNLATTICGWQAHGGWQTYNLPGPTSCD